MNNFWLKNRLWIIFVAFCTVFKFSYVEVESRKFEVKIAIPKNVVSGSTITLHCSFTCEINEVYTIKWYRGNNEFYRCIFLENIPQKKAFDYSNLIDVDLPRSNATQVILKNVSKLLAGRYICEVTAYSSLTTISNSESLYVYDSTTLLKPIIKTEERILKNHKSLSILCSTDRKNESNKHSVIFYVNNQIVGSEFVVYDEESKFLILNVDLFRWKDKKRKVIFCRLNLPGTRVFSDQIRINYNTSDGGKLSNVLTNTIILILIYTYMRII